MELPDDPQYTHTFGPERSPKKLLTLVGYALRALAEMTAIVLTGVTLALLCWRIILFAWTGEL